MITDAIYGKLFIAGIGNQILQINITTKLGVVTLYGWAAPKQVYDKVVTIATTTACVVRVEKPDFYFEPNNPTRPAPGCAEGFKRCGDICIPNSDHCSFDIEIMDQKAEQQTKPNSNSSSNMNSYSNSNMKK
jgi:hypothetical protein